MTLCADRARGSDVPLSGARAPAVRGPSIPQVVGGGEIGFAYDGGRFLVAGVTVARPDGSPYSFASGHATTAFAVAPLLTRSVGWEADAPARALATLTALGPRKDRRQELSEVLDGATFGILGRLPGRVSVDRDGIGLTLDF
jgi:hypothetical protein